MKTSVRESQIRRFIQNEIDRKAREYSYSTRWDPKFWFYEVDDLLFFHMDHNNGQLVQEFIDKMGHRLLVRFGLNLIAPEISYLMWDEELQHASDAFKFVSINDFPFNRALAIAEVDGQDKILITNYGTRYYNSRNLDPSLANSLDDYGIVRIGGYNIHDNPDWDKFITAFVKAYHMTPIESYMQNFGEYPAQAIMDADKIYEVGTENIEKYGCAYASVCPNHEKECEKTCVLSSPVRTSISPKRFRDAQDDKLIKMARIH